MHKLHGNIVTKQRNRLKEPNTRRLLKVKTNKQLLRKLSAPAKEGELTLLEMTQKRLAERRAARAAELEAEMEEQAAAVDLDDDEEGAIGWEEEDNLDLFEAFMQSMDLVDYTAGVFEGAGAHRLADSLQLGSVEEDAAAAGALHL